MKCSIITVCYNSASTIGRSIESVARQSHPDIEHIVIDGASTDRTTAILASHRQSIAKLVSEPDKGIYDAMNKGLAHATGELIGFLNADDFYAHDDVIAHVVAAFAGRDVDAIFGDVAFFRQDRPDKIGRLVKSQLFSPTRFAFGIMPAHPASFLRGKIYERTGPYRTNFKVAGDFDFFVRAFQSGPLRFAFLPEVLVKMQAGGVSTSWRNILTLNREIARACRENGVPTNPLKLSARYLLKASQLRL